MPDIKISQLPAGTTPLGGTEQVPIVQSGITVRVPSSAVGGGGTIKINQQTTDYTLQQSDNGNGVVLNSSGTITVTCPAGLGIFSCLLIQKGSGTVTIVAGGGCTLHSFGALTNLGGQYAMATLVADVANAFIIGGALA